jgi:GNAT superfamily N-acetyltransferase
VIVSACDPEDPDALALVDELSAALAAITGDSGKSSFAVADARAARSVFVVARDAGGGLLGCGALRPLEGAVAEVKRMYARPGRRGVGAGVLAYLEERAAGFGYTQVWLETRRVNVKAVAFYRAHGYGEIPNYGKYVGREDAICLGKRLG